MEREAPISFWMPPVPIHSHFVSCFVPVSFRKTSFLCRNNFKKQPNNVLKSFSNRSKIALACCCSCAVGSQKRFFYAEIALKSHPTTLDGFWCVLGSSWAPLGASWGRLAALGRLRSVLRRSCGRLGGVFGASWGRLGASWVHLRVVLGSSWGVLGTSWRVLAASWGLFWTHVVL